MIGKLTLCILTVTVLAGCQTKDALFVGTYSRVGIDASADGDGGGIGIKNVAMTIAPTKANGEAYDVLGTSDIDLSFTKLALKEVIATGEAAECASGAGKNSLATLYSNADAKTASAPLIFVAGTSWSLIEVTVGQASGASLSFGYRRVVGIRMPIKNEKLGSSYSSVSISTLSEDHSNGAPKSEVEGTRSKYIFATGKAAINMARQNVALLNGGTATPACN